MARLSEVFLHIDNEVHSEGAHPLYSALSRQGLDPSQLAYNLCRLDGWLILTASAFNRLQPVCHQSWSHYYAELSVSSPTVAETIACTCTHCTYPRRDGQAEWA